MFVFNLIIPEIHVKGEIHELLADFAEREDVKADSHSYGRTSVIRSHPSVVPNLKPEQKDRSFRGRKRCMRSQEENGAKKSYLLSRAEMSRGSEKLFAAEPPRRKVEEKKRNHRAILLIPSLWLKS